MIDVLIIGSGGREHAIVKAVKNSKLLRRLACTPANGGIAQECETFSIPAEDIDGIVNLVENQKFSFVICGPEVPLSLGLADILREKGIPVYGPNKNGAMLEASKAFSKNFLRKYNIPTAKGENFKNFLDAEKYIKNCGHEVVIKASGLAAGKGVVIPSNTNEAISAAKEMLENGIFGDSGKEIVIEEKMFGEETSIMLMVDGEKYIMLPPSQDHKRVGEGDTGPNTGGMGAYAPADCATEKVLHDVTENIIKPTLKALKTEGIDYRGTLYIGIMITPQGSKVVEFNVRFGDPECQVLLPLIDGDVLKIMYDIALGKLDSSIVKIKNQYAVVVVMCAEGYPNQYKKGDEISFPSNIPEDSYIIHAGTKLNNGRIFTNGGRVLGATACGKTLEEALSKAYQICNSTKFNGAFFRRDIAHKQLSRH